MTEITAITWLSNLESSTLFTIACLIVIVGSLFTRWLGIKKKVSATKVLSSNFVQLRYHLEGGFQDSKVGVLRSLTADHATMIAQENHITKGCYVELDMGSLNKGWAYGNSLVKARVLKTKRISSEPEKWLVTLRFVHENDQSKVWLDEFLSREKRANK